MQSDPAGPIPAQTRTLPLHDTISAQARFLWEHYGRPACRDDEIWLEAERQVLGVDPQVTQLPGGAVATPPLRTAGDAPRSPAGAPRGAPPPAVRAGSHPHASSPGNGR